MRDRRQKNAEKEAPLGTPVIPGGYMDGSGGLTLRETAANHTSKKKTTG